MSAEPRALRSPHEGVRMPLDQQLMQRLFESPQLPSLPAIALQIIDLVQQDEVDVDKIAETISLDPALSTKLLKTVNSSFYGLPKTVGSVHQAVVVLGLNSVKTLALGFSLVSNLTQAGGNGFDHMRFWRRSLYCATAAKQLCEQLHIVQAEEVFMASLLQDVGVLALAQVLGSEYATLINQAGDEHIRLAAIEQKSLGGDHMEVGAALAESWGLPPLLVESIRLHENPEASPENLMPLIRTVTAGAIAADLIENPDDASRVAKFYDVMRRWFEIEQSAADAMLRVVFAQASETQRLFELPTGDLAQADAILERAKQVMQQLATEAGKAAATAADDPIDEVVIDQADREAIDPEHRDELTGLPNRRRFEERFDELFLLSSKQDPMGLLFIDLDSFKNVNDSYGEQCGDRVLTAIAQLIHRIVGSLGETYRHGDDAFAVLAPGIDRQNAALLAETVRSAIESSRFGVDDSENPAQATLTASIGVAAYEGVLFKRADQLFKAASKGVLAAKDGGCNVVRVFVPKLPTAKNEAA